MRHLSSADISTFAATLLMSMLLTACTVGPNYQAPPVPPNDAYTIHDATVGGSNSRSLGTHPVSRQVFERAQTVRVDWYSLFGSAKLNRLIKCAVHDSPTLAASRARIQAARELVNQNQGALYPHIGINAGYSRERTVGVQSGITGSANTNVFNLYQAQATASYNLDIFGKNRRLIERSKARLHKQQYEALNAYVTLINNIVVTAIAEAGLNAAIQATREIAESQANALRIIHKRVQYGIAIKADATQIRTQLARTRASLQPLLKQKALAVNRLAVLVGATPGEFTDPGFTLSELHLPRHLPVSLPSQLVQRRPDILAAQAAVHAASAQVGVATANLLPSFTISAAYGRAGFSFADLADPAYALYSLGVSLTAPLFNGGSLRAAKRRAQDLYRAARAEYRATVLAAFADVANSLRALEADVRALKARRKALEAARDNLQTVRAQVHNGTADFLNLYVAQSQYQNARLAFIKTRVTRYRDTANLFRALGGGWSRESTPLITDSSVTDTNPTITSNYQE